MTPRLLLSSSFVVVMTYAAELGTMHASQCCLEMPSKFALNFAQSIVSAALFELTHAGCMPTHRLQCLFSGCTGISWLQVRDQDTC